MSDPAPIGYALVSEDLTSLGGPMGSERTRTNFIKYFHKQINAMQFAEADYQKNGGDSQIQWRNINSKMRSQDLSFVMYHITPLHPED